MDRLITRQEAAEMLGLTARGLINREQKGIPGPKPHRAPGQAVRYKLSEVQEFIRNFGQDEDGAG